MTKPIIDPSNIGAPIGFHVRHADLVLIMKIGTDEIAAQLTPESAMVIARDLLVAAMDHGEARAMQRVNADAIAGDAINKASH